MDGSFRQELVLAHQQYFIQMKNMNGKLIMIKKMLIVILLCGAANCYASGWECISRVFTCHTWRMEVPQGWIVSGDNSAGGGEHGYAMTYLPDPTHAWKP